MNDHENTTNSTETHQDLVTFLTLKSWHIRGSGALGELWENDLGRTIAVPKGITPRHFEWDGIVRRLADSEKRSASAIDLALKRLYTDVAEFRAADDTYIRGSIPVDAGYALVSAARQFMRSSATTSRSPKAHIDGKYSSAGESIAERARFAHTIDGSYILPMLVPLSRPAKPGERTNGANGNGAGPAEIAKEAGGDVLGWVDERTGGASFLTGLLYPLVVTGVAQGLFNSRANGSLAADTNVEDVALRLAAVVDGLGLQILTGNLTSERAAGLIVGALELELGLPQTTRSSA